MAALSISAIVPSLLLIWFFYKRDVFPEPGKVVWATFGLGVGTVVPVLVFALPVGAVIGTVQQPYVDGGISAFLLAAIPEEFFKFTVLLLYVRRHSAFDEPMDGLVYGAAASLGFATLENILYVSGGGLGTALMRAITAVPCHAMLGAIMGYYVGQAKFDPQRRTRHYALALAIPMLLHGLYDMPLMVLQQYEVLELEISDGHAGVLILVVLAVLVTMIVAALRLAASMRRAQLHAQQLAWANYAAYGGAPQQQPPYAQPPYAQPPYAQPSYAPAPVSQPGWGPPPPASPGYGPPPAAPPPYWQSPPPPPYGPPHASAPPYAYGGAAHPPPVAVSASSRSGAGWTLLSFGALLAIGGGLMSLGGLAVVAEEGADLATVLTLAAIGLLPLAGGTWMFVVGASWLNSPGRPRS